MRTPRLPGRPHGRLPRFGTVPVGVVAGASKGSVPPLYAPQAAPLDEWFYYRRSQGRVQGRRRMPKFPEIAFWRWRIPSS